MLDPQERKSEVLTLSLFRDPTAFETVPIPDRFDFQRTEGERVELHTLASACRFPSGADPGSDHLPNSSFGSVCSTHLNVVRRYRELNPTSRHQTGCDASVTLTTATERGLLTSDSEPYEPSVSRGHAQPSRNVVGATGIEPAISPPPAVRDTTSPYPDEKLVRPELPEASP